MAAKRRRKGNSLDLNEIINAIPKEINEERPTLDPLGDLIAKISKRQVPVRTLTRIWTLGSMQAKIAVGYLAYAIRRNFINDSEKQRLLNETNLKTAIELLGTMGYLRGAIIKIGQMLGNIQEIFPDEIADALDSLHFEAPPMHYSLIREVFLDELGEEPEELFSSFDKNAFAAASLGQVHPAMLKSGEPVAVKIQYPNMAATIRSDLGTMRTLLTPIKLKREWSYSLEHLKDTEHMLLREADYCIEARFMEKVRALFGANDQIVVPRVWRKFSRERVLTMDHIPGLHLREYLATNPSQESRNHFGTLISTAFIRIWGRMKTIYTDPNPGNFLFMDDGRLGFIDFGSYRELSRDEWQNHIQSERATFANDSASIDKAMAKVCLCSDISEMDPEHVKLMRDITFWQAEPALKNGFFDFGDRDFYQRGIDLHTESIKKPHSRYNSLYNWWSRSILYHRTLLYRLQSCIPYRDIYEKEKTY